MATSLNSSFIYRIMYFYILYHFIALYITSSVNGFGQPRRQIQTIQTLPPPLEPHPPQSEIAPQALLHQASRLLTLKDVKSVLRRYVKISGGKSDLFREVGRLLNATHINDTLQSVVNGVQNAAITAAAAETVGKKKEPKEKYKQLTVKELKSELRLRGAKVSGRKNELIQRLINLDADSNNTDVCATSEDKEWFVLNATIIDFNCSTLPSCVEDEELPILSTLLFVNKPCGMSTLPTRQVDNEHYPTFPCLSDEVKNWLANHPDGMELIRRARADEEEYWKYTLQSLQNQTNKQTKHTYKHKQKQYQKLQTKQSSFIPRPIHRLDIDTSGIVCIALTPYALRCGGKLFERKTVSSNGAHSNANTDSADGSNVNDSNANGVGDVEKCYTALVEGKMTSNKGMISHSIGKVWIQDTNGGHHEWACDILNNGSVAFSRPGLNHGVFVEGSLREALTSYRVIKRRNGQNCTLVELTPHTGRGHQLRLHLASLGHVIVGDKMHGVEENQTESKLHLHASKLVMNCWRWDGNGVKRCRASVSSHPWFC